MSGSSSSPKPQFLGDFLDFKRIDHRSSPLTLDSYRLDLCCVARWFCGHPLETITKADFRRYVADMESKGMASATIKRRWSALNQYFTYLIDESEVEGLTRLPTRGFKFPINDREESFHLLPAQRRQLFDYLQQNAGNPIGKLDLALFGLLYFAALRVSEGVSRTYNDLYEEGGHRRLHVLGKRSKEREVVLHPQAISWLEAWLEVRPDIVLNPDYLFLHPSRETVVSRKLVWSRLKKAVHDAGFDKEIVNQVSPHTMRHSRASDLKRADYPPPVIQRLLGHSSVQTTEIYLHPDEKKVDKEVDDAVLGVD